MTSYILYCRKQLADTDTDNDYWLQQLRQARRISSYLPHLEDMDESA